MIINLKKTVSKEKASQLSLEHKAFLIRNDDSQVLITSSSLKEVPRELESYTDSYLIFDNDIQLASKKYRKHKQIIQVGNSTIGGNSNNTLLIGGPCSVESIEQLLSSAELISKLGLTTLRGGSFKPRTSPYSFQGLGLEGLKLLGQIRNRYGLNIITEVRDASHVNEVIEFADIIQIGAKAMYDHGILRACSKTVKPVLLKRGFGSTLQEFVQAAEFILSGGNPNVILCERGIRTFETGTRFTLDLCGVAWLQEYINLPIFLDPSHAMGYAYGVPALSKACISMGIDGLVIETHPNPNIAKSDASQQISHEEFELLFNLLKPIAQAVGYNII